METGINSRMRIPEIASRLNVCRDTVYSMLEAGQLPGLRIGRRWLVTRPAYEAREKTCGGRPVGDFRPGLQLQPEVGS